MKKWYIVQTFSGFAQKVAEVIREKSKTNELSDKIENVEVPMHQVTEVKRGKRVQKQKKFFPSYSPSFLSSKLMLLPMLRETIAV